jgi:hypothetical protein
MMLAMSLAALPTRQGSIAKISGLTDGCETPLTRGLHDARAAGRALHLVMGYIALLRTSTLVTLIGLFSVYRTIAEAEAARPIRRQVRFIS